MKNINERFTVMSYAITDWCGQWYVTAIGMVALIGWIALGSPMHYSDTWQLVANTPTTWIELFLGFFTLAAANRNDKRSKQLIDQQNELLRKIANLEQQLLQKEESIEVEIKG